MSVYSGDILHVTALGAAMSLADLRGASSQDLAGGADGVVGLEPVRSVSSADPLGLGLEVLIVEWSSGGEPKSTSLRKLHSNRVGKKIYPLVIAAIDPFEKVWIFGPNPDAQPTGPLSTDHAVRMLQAALDEPNGLAARQRLSHFQRSLETMVIPGIANSGLFASHYLTSATGVRGGGLWEPAAERAKPLLPLRGFRLVAGLGFTAKKTGANASLLSIGSARPRAVAVLLDEGETFDASSPRFAVSPVAYGLSLAQKQEVPWLIVLRGSQIRLYPASPDVGVGRRGQAETYFEVDLALLASEDAAFLDLAFSAGGLAEGGSVQHLLQQSERLATELGHRLRQRVYVEVIPVLAIAVARELERKFPDRADDLDLAYRLTLRILFRLLFQAYAEDRGLLPFGRNSRYDRNALKTWAMDLAADPEMGFDPESQSMWDDLTQVWRVIDNGDSAWGVPAYDGGLFGSDPDLYPDGALLAQLSLDNTAMGPALLHLLVDQTVDGSAGAVDFRSLSVREFGTIYEGLLESNLSRADFDLTIDKNAAYVPAKKKDDAVVAAAEIYFHNSSGERKATGSYFTPSFAVEHLVERALDPTLEEHLRRIEAMLEEGDEAGAAEAFFDFRVADLAMGSGHFLVAAVDHIEAGMAAFLAEHHLPAIVNELRRLEGSARDALGSSQADYEIEPSALLRRQIARRCIYGIDLNPIAVELARVAMWIHTFVPGLPMSSLDHALICANSLTGIGTIEEALASLEPEREAGMPSLFSMEIELALEEARKVLVHAANTSEATKAEVRQAIEAAAVAATKAAPTSLLFDAAVALRIGLLSRNVGLGAADMQELVRHPTIRAEIDVLQPAHTPFLFPEVFLRPEGGFDVIIGNPPWEKIKVEEHSWWGLRFPGLHRSLPQRKTRQLIGELRKSRPDLLAEYEADVERTAAMRRVIASGPFPGLGTGDLDLYQAFAWRSWQLLRKGGRFGVVLPRGALAGAGMAEWRRSVLGEGELDVCFLTNSGQWVFADVDGRYTIALTCAGKTNDSKVRFSGPFFNPSDFESGRLAPVVVEREELLAWSERAAFPYLPEPDSAEVFLRLRESPRFDGTHGFDFRPTTELHATGDRGVVRR